MVFQGAEIYFYLALKYLIAGGSERGEGIGRQSEVPFVPPLINGEKKDFQCFHQELLSGKFSHKTVEFYFYYNKVLQNLTKNRL